MPHAVGLHHKILGFPRENNLQYAFVRLTSRCSGRCGFCEVWKNPADAHASLDWERIIADFLVLKPKEINLHGGEAHLSAQFVPFLEALGGAIPLSITTKGDALLHRSFPVLVRNGLQRVFLSIDRALPESNALHRGVPALATGLFPAIRSLRNEHPHIRVIVNHVVTRANAHEIRKLVETMLALSVHHIALIPVKDAPDQYLSVRDVQNFRHEVRGMLEEGVVGHEFFLNGFTTPFGSEEDDASLASQGLYNTKARCTCMIPSGTLFIDAVTGNVYPCDTTMYRENQQRYIMGNLMDSGLREIWDGPAFVEFRRLMLSESPAPCRFSCDPCNVFC